MSYGCQEPYRQGSPASDPRAPASRQLEGFSGARNIRNSLLRRISARRPRQGSVLFCYDRAQRYDISSNICGIRPRPLRPPSRRSTARWLKTKRSPMRKRFWKSLAFLRQSDPVCGLRSKGGRRMRPTTRSRLGCSGQRQDDNGWIAQLAERYPRNVAGRERHVLFAFDGISHHAAGDHPGGIQRVENFAAIAI